MRETERRRKGGGAKGEIETGATATAGATTDRKCKPRQHKPDTPSERKRIEDAGGNVETICGVPRVCGNLATSRAIGDMPLKQFVIPDPDVTHVKLSKGDAYVIIASDGLWDYVTPAAAGAMVEKAGQPQKAARMLVDFALRNGSFDNIGVVVMDVRHIFSDAVSPYSSVEPSARLDMTAEVRSLACDLLAQTDLFYLHDECSGWLLKESSGGFFGKRWQKRWFVCNVISGDVFSDGSCHRQMTTKSFILHYHEGPDKALTTNPSKVTFVDPEMGARLEPHLNGPGRHVISLYEASTGQPFLLAAPNDEGAKVWAGKLNDSFRRHGFLPAACSSIRTMDINAPEVVRTLSCLAVDRQEVTNPVVDIGNLSLESCAQPLSMHDTDPVS
eukprot:Tamp_14243.p1 GENE.Tamp_14243~~Tamp_14243.p1  ORF type:complete len:387 (-),score=59.33 Tamp_14243:181-1341(-)